nr:substrate-binding domain-containing protein [Alkalicoccobacillus plakortidis]
MSSNDLHIEESLEFQSIEAIKHCVKNGLGISLVPLFSVKEEIKNHILSGEIVSKDTSTLSTYLTYHKDKWLSPSIMSMIELIKEHSSEWK